MARRRKRSKRNYRIPNRKSSQREIRGRHNHRPAGTSILWPAMYRELRKKGYSKGKSARISNAAWNRKHGRGHRNTRTRSSRRRRR